MALCTQCGVIFHDSDMGKHECRVEDIPQPGQQKRPSVVSEALRSK